MLAGFLAVSVMNVSAASSDSAVIANSGSTNTIAFEITIDKSGDAEFREIPRGAAEQSHAPQTIRIKLPESLKSRIFSDLESAKPLTSLPAGGCLKSSSFGTRARIRFGGEETPDLSCPNATNPRIQALRRDMNNVVEAFHVNLLRRPVN